MIAPDNCFARQFAGTSLNQIGPAAETASPFSRRTTQGPAVTSFAPLPKLPLQDCADAAIDTLQPVSAGPTETHLPKLEFLFSVSALIRVSSFGGETTPYGGGGERRRRVLPRPPPGVSRAGPVVGPFTPSSKSTVAFNPYAAKGNADKAAMIAAARARGFSPADDNEADAIAILFLALETKGGLK